MASPPTHPLIRAGALYRPTTAPATDTATSGLNGRLQRIAQRLTSLIALLPTALGSAAAASSLAVTASTEDIARVGIITETASSTDTASSGLNGRLQRIAQRLTSLIALLPTSLGSAAAAASLAVTHSTEDIARAGIITETAPATDTASSGHNGRLQRIAQRITSLIALLPTALGSAAASASIAVTHSTEDIARAGIITETAPATDTASSGHNGRLQRIAQRLTSLIALVPTSLTAGGYFKVAQRDATSVALSVTRTADTNVYAAGDMIGTGTSSGNAVLTFANIRPDGAGEYMITSAELEIDATALISGETSYNLYLHNAAPNSNSADNASFDITTGDRTTFIGKVPLGVPVDEVSTLYVRSDGIMQQITTAGTDIKAYLVTVGTYTPTSARVYKITLHGYPL